LAVTPPDPVLYVHRLKFQVECFRRVGLEFQSFFEQIMEKADRTFITVKASGREGDWKNDGYSRGTKTVYQVYAPEGLTAAAAVAKINEDFPGARERWAGKMKGWTFVWSSEKGLPPQVLDTLLEIERANQDIKVDDWGREDLWCVVRDLDERDRVELLGPTPIPTQATTNLIVQVTASEVQALLNFVSEQEITPSDDDLTLLDLREKMDKNAFSTPVRAVINGGLPLLGTVGYYVNHHPDARFSQRVSAALLSAYDDLRAAFEGDNDAIFFGLVDRVAPAAQPDERSYWAAVAIIDFYFELCDIFER
jgi:hypothetical protein